MMYRCQLCKYIFTEDNLDVCDSVQLFPGKGIIEIYCPNCSKLIGEIEWADFCQVDKIQEPDNSKLEKEERRNEYEQGISGVVG